MAGSRHREENEPTNGSCSSSLHRFEAGLLGGVMVMMRSSSGRTWWHELAMTDETWRENELLHRDSVFANGCEQDWFAKVSSQVAAPQPAVFQYVLSE
jgi:hypothetical protein